MVWDGSIFDNPQSIGIKEADITREHPGSDSPHTYTADDKNVRPASAILWRNKYMPTILTDPGTFVFSGSTVCALFNCGFVKLTMLWEKFNGTYVEDFSEEAKKRMEFGTLFEDAVARFFMHKTGLKVKQMGKGRTAYFRKDMPYFICHPDRVGINVDSKGRRFALECKCVSPYAEGWGEEWTDQIPDYYYIQCQCYFATGVPCDVVYVAVMKGNAVYIYEVLPDEEIIAEILKRVREAYDSFSQGIIPSSEDCKVAIKRWGSQINRDAEAVGADENILEAVHEISEVHRAQNELKKKEDSLKAKFADFMQSAPAIVAVRDGELCKIATWAKKTTNGLDEAKLIKDHPEINIADYRTTKISPYVKVNYEEAV